MAGPGVERRPLGRWVVKSHLVPQPSVLHSSQGASPSRSTWCGHKVAHTIYKALLSFQFFSHSKGNRCLWQKIQGINNIHEHNARGDDEMRLPQIQTHRTGH